MSTLTLLPLTTATFAVVIDGVVWTTLARAPALALSRQLASRAPQAVPLPAPPPAASLALPLARAA